MNRRQSSQPTEFDVPPSHRSFSVPITGLPGGRSGRTNSPKPRRCEFRNPLRHALEDEYTVQASLGTQCNIPLAQVAFELAPVPGIGALMDSLRRVFQAVERSRVNRQQWKLLQGRCVMVARMAALQVDNYGQHDYPGLQNAANMIEETFDLISARAQYYNEMNEMLALLSFQTISEEIRLYFNRLDSCLALFSYATDVAQSQWVSEFRSVQQQELADIARVHRLLSSVSVDMKNMAEDQGQLRRSVEVLREELVAKFTILENRATTTVERYIDAQQIVRTILEVTTLHLPPKILLGRQCVQEAHIPIKTGITCDVYAASFLGGEKVAKKVFRIGMSDHNSVKQYAERFVRIASLWSELRSDYTLPFYGIGMESSGGDQHFQLYMVSPLMRNYDAVSYLKRTRDNLGMKQGILRIITDAALGLQYLHNRSPPVVHSGMRGDNILITDSGGAVLGGFGLTKALASETNNKIPVAIMTGRTESQRWMAPELFVDEIPQLKTPCDVWGWAMAALEIVSGSIPYYSHPQIHIVMGEIRSGPPRRQDHIAFEKYAYRPNEIWDLFEKCWAKDPNQRPTMDQVVTRLKEIATMPEHVEF